MKTLGVNMSGQVTEQPSRSPPIPAPAPADSLTARLVPILAREVGIDARRRAALHLLDWIGCAVLGAETEPGRVFRAWGRDAGGTGRAKAIGVRRIDAPGAAFVNGSFGNVLEMDDVHRTAILHPGPTVIPAALAAAERQGADAASLLDAIVRGYEAVIRIGSSMGPGHYKHWHTTSTCGPFGAAAAVASLRCLDPQRFIAALGLAGTQSSGPWQMRIEGGMAKQLHAARAAQAGLVAADLAERGLTGPAAILEGPLGLYAATAPDAMPDEVTRDPDAVWKIFETSVKPWPACRHAHAAIDAALALRQRLPDLDQVAQLDVRTYRDALTFCDRPDPQSVIDAKFSLQHAVAITLRDGPPPLGAFEPAAYSDPRLAKLRAKVQVTEADPYASAFPRRYGAALIATLIDGSSLSAEIPDALGDPENPLPESGWIAKADRLMEAAGLDAARRDAIVDATLALADGAPVDALTELLP